MSEFNDISGINPFYTFDQFDCEGIIELLTVLDSNYEDFLQFLKDNPVILERIQNQGIENPQSREDIPWDDANLIFIASKSDESKSLTDIDVPQPSIFQQESRITTPPVNTVPISPQITSATNQNVGLSLPANFASLSTADKLKTLNDLGIRIG